MWIFTKNSFISAVEHRDRPNDLIIRARRRKDLAKLFPRKEKLIQKTPNADYLYRITISKKEFAKVLSDYVLRNLKYSNFKAAQDPDGSEWTQFLHQVWEAGYSMQASL